MVWGFEPPGFWVEGRWKTTPHPPNYQSKPPITGKLNTRSMSFFGLIELPGWPEPTRLIHLFVQNGTYDEGLNY